MQYECRYIPTGSETGCGNLQLEKGNMFSFSRSESQCNICRQTSLRLIEVVNKMRNSPG